MNIELKEEQNEAVNNENLTTNTNQDKINDANSNSNETSIKKKNDDDVFCIPSIPIKSIDIDKKKSQSLPTLQYTKPEWSATPPECSGENRLDEEGYCQHYYLEVIKNGTVIDTISLNKEYLCFGRLETCDVLCEHPTLSRYHAILQYSNGDSKFPQGFYVYDLNSTHGTFINKTKLEPNKYTLFDLDSMLKFGQSTRIYILHGPKPKNSSEDLKINLTHEQMKMIKENYSKIAMKLKIRKELEEDEELENRKASDKEKGVDWGLNNDLEEDDEFNSELNPFATEGVVDDSYYSSDPKKALKNFFEREGEELDYETDEIKPGKYRCRIRLPIHNNYGEEIYAECEHEGKKKDAIAQCALEACRILNSQGILKQSSQEAARKKKQKNWETDDYYDSDEDTYLDRTGDIEKKRLQRMAQAGKLESTNKSETNKNKVHTFDSLKNDIKLLLKEQNDLETKLEKCKNISKAINEDDVDSYIQSLKSGADLDTITRAKFRKRLVEIKNEIVKLDKLIQVAKPASFEIDKWKKELIEEFNKTETSNKPVETVKIKEPKPEIEAKIEVKKSEVVIKKDTESKEEKILNEFKKPENLLPTESSQQKSIDQEEISSKPKRKKLDQVSIDSVSPYETFHKDYDMWMPPQDQTGDGKTKLNEKYGY